MSGPKVAIVVPPEPVTAMVYAAAIHAAAAVAESHARAQELADANRAERADIAAGQVAASDQGLAAIEAEAAAAEARFEQVLMLGQRLGVADRLAATRPLRPDSAHAATLAAYVRALQALAVELESILKTEAALRLESHSAEPNQIALLAARSGIGTETARRLLARVAHLGQLPEEVTQLAAELEATPAGDRAELLASELRRRIQDLLESRQKEMVQRATATIVEQSLKDLGYQVEDIVETLFVDGGVVHFRRAGWGDYLVRLRVDAAAPTVNFNVVRATDNGSNERSVLDHIAEDRWCAEFPALLKALEARGMRLQVTRHLAPGELPVQLVDRGRLPRFADDKAAMPAAQLLAKEIK
jgi:ElaB/YqjD/DUF883 family membrane-anchored ribosome-binding protein